MKKFLIIFGISLLLIGCTTNSNTPTKWVKVTNKHTNKQYILTRTKNKCKAKAYREIRRPIIMPCYGTGFVRGACEGENANIMRNYRQMKYDVYTACMYDAGYISKN